MPRLVFISHRHADVPLATVLNNHLQKWQVGREEIFQSSNADGGAHLGGQLNKELLQALSDARIVLLIYTIADADWSYCMWECGVATDPRQGDSPTRIVVFRTTEDVPPVLRDLVSVRTSDERDVRRFVQQFFTEKGWIKDNDAFNARVSDKVLDEYARALYTDLIEVTPKTRAEERRRWDVFTLMFTAGTLQEILQSHIGKQDMSEETRNLILNRGQVVYDFGQALMHFGYVAGTRGLNLMNLIQRWSEEVANEPDEATPRDWINELCEEMLRAARNTPAKPTWAVMLSRLFPAWWFLPIVNHQRIKVDGSTEFDIYMYRLPGQLPSKVELPDN
jgi:hypothetical protein